MDKTRQGIPGGKISLLVMAARQSGLIRGEYYLEIG